MTVVYVIMTIMAIFIIVELGLIKSMNDNIRRQKQRYDHLLRGNNPELNLEELLVELNKQIEQSNKDMRTIDQRSLDAKDTTMGAVSHMAIVHFDAFEGQSGGLSFSLCLLDNFHNGIVLTSLYSNDGSNVYVKEIINGSAEKELSDSEKKAIEKAKG